MPGSGSQRDGREGEKNLLVGPSGDLKIGLSVVCSISPEIKPQTSYESFSVAFQGTYPSTGRLVNRTFIKMLMLEDVFLLQKLHNMVASASTTDFKGLLVVPVFSV